MMNMMLTTDEAITTAAVLRVAIAETDLRCLARGHEARELDGDDAVAIIEGAIERTRAFDNIDELQDAHLFNVILEGLALYTTGRSTDPATLVQLAADDMTY